MLDDFLYLFEANLVLIVELIIIAFVIVLLYHSVKILIQIVEDFMPKSEQNQQEGLNFDTKNAKNHS